MNAPVSITAPLDPATLAMVEVRARARGISQAQFAAEAIRRAVEEETELAAFLQAGTESAERGEIYTQDQVEAWFEKRVAARQR